MPTTKKWRDLTVAQRSLVIGAVCLHAGTTFAAYRDLRRRDEERIKGSTRFWRVAIFVNRSESV